MFEQRITASFRCLLHNLPNAQPTVTVIGSAFSQDAESFHHLFPLDVAIVACAGILGWGTSLKTLNT